MGFDALGKAAQKDLLRLSLHFRVEFHFSSRHEISKPNSIITTCRKKQPRSEREMGER